jgi:two-component system, cell cycle sensor histidine kinase and response regulator CckA
MPEPDRPGGPEQEPTDARGGTPDGADEAYRRLFESHPAAMAIWDPATGRILAANEAASRQYGYAPEDLVELTVDRIVHPDDLPRLRAEIPNLPAGLAGSAPFRHVRRNGEVIEVEMSGHPLEWHGRPARLVMAIDVTDRRRLEQELRSARAIEAVGRLAGGIAHDFNNLVMAINGFADLLLDRLADGSEEHAAAVEIQTAGLRAAALTAQLLAFARPHEPQPTRFDLNGLVAGLDETLRSISGPNVRVRIAALASQATIVADRDHVARAIVGCVLNARDAMPDGGELRVETIDVDPNLARQLTGAVGDRPFVGLAISDTGPTGAFPSDGSVATSRTGLGLALVYSTVQMAGGRIRLESTPGHGSTVRILLPLAGEAAPPGDVGDADASGALGATEARHAADRPVDLVGSDRSSGAVVDDRAEDVGSPGGGEARGSRVHDEGTVGPRDVGRPLVIAVVEDEPGVRTLVERLLVRGGHRVLVFADGTAALDALGDGQVAIDLLITDLVMPGPNGIEVARRIRRDRPGLPVLLMSGYAADALRAERISEASIELIAKPFTATELIDRVAAVLATAADGG